MSEGERRIREALRETRERFTTIPFPVYALDWEGGVKSLTGQSATRDQHHPTGMRPAHVALYHGTSDYDSQYVVVESAETLRSRPYVPEKIADRLGFLPPPAEPRHNPHERWRGLSDLVASLPWERLLLSVDDESVLFRFLAAPGRGWRAISDDPRVQVWLMAKGVDAPKTRLHTIDSIDVYIDGWASRYDGVLWG